MNLYICCIIWKYKFFCCCSQFIRCYSINWCLKMPTFMLQHIADTNALVEFTDLHRQHAWMWNRMCENMLMLVHFFVCLLRFFWCVVVVADAPGFPLSYILSHFYAASRTTFSINNSAHCCYYWCSSLKLCSFFLSFRFSLYRRYDQKNTLEPNSAILFQIPRNTEIFVYLNIYKCGKDASILWFVFFVHHDYNSG